MWLMIVHTAVCIAELKKPQNFERAILPWDKGLILYA